MRQWDVYGERHPEIDAVIWGNGFRSPRRAWLAAGASDPDSAAGCDFRCGRHGFRADRCAEAFQRALFLPDQRTGGGAAFAGADEWKSCRKRN